MSTHAHHVDVDQLAAALRRTAAGLLAEEAATDLLIAHGVWLRRTDFGDYLDYSEDPQVIGEGSDPLAVVLWADLDAAVQAGQFAASTSAYMVLDIARSLACGDRINLRDSVVGLDATNTALVLAAIAHAAGHHTLAPAPQR